MSKRLEVPRNSRFMILASIFVVVAGLRFAREVLIPVALSVLITFLLAPLIRRLEKLHLGRVPSVLLVVALALGLFGGLTWMVKEQFIQVANELPNYESQIIAKLQRLRLSSGSLGTAYYKLQKTVEDVTPKATATTQATQPTTVPSVPAVAGVTPGDAPKIPTQVAPPPREPLPVRVISEAPSPLENAIGYVRQSLDPLTNAGLVLVFVVFMLLRREDLRDRLIRLVGFGRLDVTTQAMDEAGSRITRYLVAQSIVNTCYGGLVTLGLWLTGIIFGTAGHGFPNFLLWGLLCGMFRFIPYVGPVIGATGPLLISFGFFPGNGVLIAVLAMFITLELITSQAAEPLIYGSSTGISTLAVLVSAVFWTWLWGPIGLLLSTPLTAVLVVVGKYVPQLQFLDIMLGDEPVLSPPMRLYQRLLAGDEDEARKLSGGFLKESDLLGAYDDVFLPTLALAKRDRLRQRLTPERMDQILRSIRTLGDELLEIAKKEAAEGSTDDEAATSASARTTSGQPTARRAPELSLVPEGCNVNILVMPANDEADEVASWLMARILEKQRFCALVLTEAALASEMVEAVDKHGAHAVVVCALPPGATAHARYLCRRLHARHKSLNLVVALLTARGNPRRAIESIACAPTTLVSTTLRRSLEIIHQVTQPVMVGMNTAPVSAQVTQPDVRLDERAAVRPDRENRGTASEIPSGV